MTADSLVHTALREALANCIINADYYGRQGLVIIKKKDVIILASSRILQKLVHLVKIQKLLRIYNNKM